MILPDVNVLLHAFRSDLASHHRYRTWLDEESRVEPFLLPDTLLSRFLRVATLPRIWSPPAPMASVLDFVSALRARPGVARVEDGSGLWRALADLARADSGIRGNVVPDAYLAAAALTHGARLATRDRGFARFPGLRWFDPADETEPEQE